MDEIATLLPTPAEVKVAPAVQAPPAEEAPPTALDRVLQRMQANGDFPALSQAVSRIQHLAASETESVPGLAGEILKDVALTNKLLRLVNTVHYQQAGGGTVNTVSRAVALVGFAGIRNLALSLLLLERMGNARQAMQLREEFVQALMAGQLASELTPWQSDVEEAYLAGMFQNMGRLLTTFYLPDERQAIDALLNDPAQAERQPALTVQAAARRVLGVDYETLGAGVALVWSLPDNLRRALHRPMGHAPGKALPRGAERLRWLATLCNDTAACMQHPDLTQARQQVRRHADRHARALGFSAEEIGEALERARHTLCQILPAVGMTVPAGGATRRMLDFTLGQQGQPAESAPMRVLAPVPLSLLAPASTAMLSAGIQDVMACLAADDFQLNTVLRMVMETLLRGLHLDRVVLGLRDPKTQHVTGRFGMGVRVDSLVRQFDVRAANSANVATDLFSAVCAKGVDTVIDNAAHPSVRPRLPKWHLDSETATSFMLLPLVLKGATFGLLYADTAGPGALSLGDGDMALVRTLRNQAVMAFKQAG